MQAEDRVFLSCGKLQGLLLAVFKEQSLLPNKGSQNETIRPSGSFYLSRYHRNLIFSSMTVRPVCLRAQRHVLKKHAL